MTGMSFGLGSLWGLGNGKLRLAKRGNPQQGAVLEGDGTHFSKALCINGPWSPACTTAIAIDGGQVYGVWKSGRGEH